MEKYFLILSVILLNFATPNVELTSRDSECVYCPDIHWEPNKLTASGHINFPSRFITVCFLPGILDWIIWNVKKQKPFKNGWCHASGSNCSPSSQHRGQHIVPCHVVLFNEWVFEWMKPEVKRQQNSAWLNCKARLIHRTPQPSSQLGLKTQSTL